MSWSSSWVRALLLLLLRALDRLGHVFGALVEELEIEARRVFVPIEEALRGVEALHVISDTREGIRIEVEQSEVVVRRRIIRIRRQRALVRGLRRRDQRVALGRSRRVIRRVTAIRRA